jgi:hypothetical protein
MRFEEKFPEFLTDQGELCEHLRWIVREFAMSGPIFREFGFVGFVESKTLTSLPGSGGGGRGVCSSSRDVLPWRGLVARTLLIAQSLKPVIR